MSESRAGEPRARLINDLVEDSRAIWWASAIQFRIVVQFRLSIFCIFQLSRQRQCARPTYVLFVPRAGGANDIPHGISQWKIHVKCCSLPVAQVAEQQVALLSPSP